MPRSEYRVKLKPRSSLPRSHQKASRKAPLLIRTRGMIDVHFHGAWGTDLMQATPSECNRLARKLWSAGIDAFCPTTLSAGVEDLKRAVTQIGAWIKASQSHPKQGAAYPIGIHLEGPFLSAGKAGAHAPETLRPFSLQELDELYRLSQGTVVLITLAAEGLSPIDLRNLGAWARKHKVTLSLGHTQATEAQARGAFGSGFRGVTHAWNAMTFHHRDGGAIAGAFTSSSPVFVEIIPDGVHLSPAVARMTLELFGDRGVWVSDCVPAAGLPLGATAQMGPIHVCRGKTACWVAPHPKKAKGTDTLAGGATPLPETLKRILPHLIEGASQRRNGSLREEITRILEAGTESPLRYLEAQIPANHRQKRLSWKITS